MGPSLRHLEAFANILKLSACVHFFHRVDDASWLSAIHLVHTSYYLLLPLKKLPFFIIFCFFNYLGRIARSVRKHALVAMSLGRRDL
jgi:hypothetical protein